MTRVNSHLKKTSACIHTGLSPSIVRSFETFASCQGAWEGCPHSLCQPPTLHAEAGVLTVLLAWMDLREMTPFPPPSPRMWEGHFWIHAHQEATVECGMWARMWATMETREGETSPPCPWSPRWPLPISVCFSALVLQGVSWLLSWFWWHHLPGWLIMCSCTRGGLPSAKPLLGFLCPLLTGVPFCPDACTQRPSALAAWMSWLLFAHGPTSFTRPSTLSGATDGASSVLLHCLTGKPSPFHWAPFVSKNVETRASPSVIDKTTTEITWHSDSKKHERKHYREPETRIPIYLCSNGLNRVCYWFFKIHTLMVQKKFVLYVLIWKQLFSF